MATRRGYKGNAAPTTISGAINNTDTTAALSDPTIAENWPTGPSFAVLERNTTREESVLYTRSGTALTLTRGQNDTTAVNHAAGSTIEHVWTKTDADESNAHIATPSQGEADHSTLLNNTRHDDPTRHPVGTVVAAGTSITSSNPGDTTTVGTSTGVARADHLHGREPYGAAGNITSSAPGDTASAGVVNAIARIDHKHAREAPSGGTVLTYGTPGSSAVGDTALQGSATTLSRSDHRHGRESFGNVATSAGFNFSSTNGTATTVARSDHRHGSPTFLPGVFTDTTQFSITSTGYTPANSPASALQATVNVVGPGNGLCYLIVVCNCGQYTDGSNFVITSFSLSGANTRSAHDEEGVSVFGTNYVLASNGWIFISGLNPGNTTVTMQHRVTGGTGTINDRRLTVITFA